MALRRQISPIRGQKIFKNQTPKTVQLYPGQKESNEENMSRIQKNTDGENFPPLPSRQIQNNSTRETITMPPMIPPTNYNPWNPWVYFMQQGVPPFPPHLGHYGLYNHSQGIISR